MTARPLGSHRDAECSIDSLSQSFAVLCGQMDKERQKCALEHAFDALVDSENRIIKLFTPAFDESTRSPGYVKAYPKGVRENGGNTPMRRCGLPLPCCVLAM